MKSTDRFTMNGYLWRIRFVDHNDSCLVDRTGKLTVATTDPINFLVNLSEELKGDFLMTVLVHELGHCALFSFHLLDEIHRMTRPKYWIKMEEFICNILADYGMSIYKTAFRYLGYDAWELVPAELEKYIAA